MKTRLTILAILLVSACGGGEKPVEEPNLLLITIDTLRRDAVGCYGADRASTPNLDRLAGEGIFFSQAQVPVPLTLPSHTTMLTGLYPASHGVRVNALHLSDEPSTLAELFGEKGYETAAFVASQVLSRNYDLNRGFSYYDDSWIEKAGDGNMGPGIVPQRRAEAVVDSFLRWFRENRKSGRPFFAWIHFYDPHGPYDPPEPFTLILGDTDYAGEVAYTDRQIGRVLDALRREGIDEETIVTALSDHGEGLGDHDEETHGFLLYETVVAVPWILRYPGCPVNRIVQDPIESVDLLPTMASIFSLPADPAWQGTSALPRIEESGVDMGRTHYSETYFGNMAYEWAPLQSYREGRWKIVHGARDELFDLAADPGELVDRAEAEPEVLERMRERLIATRESHPIREPEKADDSISPEERGMLEALGYVAPRLSISESDTLPDPRDRYKAHDFVVRGKRLLEKGETDEARSLFEQARRIDPKNTVVLSSLADVYKREGHREKEEETLRAVLAIDTENAAAWNGLGNLLLRYDRNASEARTCYDRALSFDSTYAGAHVNVGNLLLWEVLPDRAIEHYNAAIRYDPKLAPAHYGKAMAYQKKGDFDATVQELKLALRADPTFKPAEEKLNALRAGAGR